MLSYLRHLKHLIMTSKSFPVCCDHTSTMLSNAQPCVFYEPRKLTMTLVKIYQSLDWRFDPSVARTVWIYLLVLWSFVLVKFSLLFLHFLCEISNCYGVKTGQYVDTGRYVKIRNFSTAECPFPIVRITNINSLFVLKCFSILGVIYFPGRVLDSCKKLKIPHPI